MNVGTKELKNRLSHYLRLVRAGERLAVCDRGEVVAELRGVGTAPGGDDASALAELARRGDVVVGRGRLGAFTPITGGKRGRLSTLVLRDRG